MKKLILALVLICFASVAICEENRYPAKEIQHASEVVKCLKQDEKMITIYLLMMQEVRKITKTGDEFHNIMTVMISGTLTKLLPDKTLWYIANTIKDCESKQRGQK